MMLEVYRSAWGNPSSQHGAGQGARLLLDAARERVARSLGAAPDELVFTAGGTEANNLALFGAARRAARSGRRHLLVSAIEHSSVLAACEQLRGEGFELELMPVDAEGRVRLAAAVAALRGDTALVSLMAVNNDLGTVQPLAELARRARACGAIVHSDGVQALGKLSMDLRELPVDLLSISSHKIYGPKGVGALYVRRGLVLESLLFGGSQERRLRPGTENLPGIAGFGCAAEQLEARFTAEDQRLRELRDWMEAALTATISDAWVNGERAPRVSNTSNVGFAGVDGEALAIQLDLRGIAVSTGAACSSSNSDPSHVLVAMGQSAVRAKASLRISLGRQTTRAELECFVAAANEVVQRLRR